MNINPLFQNHNLKSLKQELGQIITEKPELALKLIYDWLDLDEPPAEFFKAWLNVIYGKNIIQTEDFAAFKKAIIDREKLSVITMMITFQILQIEDMSILTIDNKNINVLNFLINGESFFINPSIKENIYTHCYTINSPQFFYEAEKMLSEHDITLAQSKNRIAYHYESIIDAIMFSGQFEYIHYFENKYNMNFKNEGLKDYFSYWDRHLTTGLFFTFDPDTQAKFINFFIQADKNRENTYLIKNYIDHYKNENKEIMAQTVDKLIERQIISLEELKEIARIDKFLTFYETYCEKKLLNQTLSNVSTPRSEKKLKL